MTNQTLIPVRLNPQQTEITAVVNEFFGSNVTSLDWDYDIRCRPFNFGYTIGQTRRTDVSHDFVKSFRRSVDWVLLYKSGINEWLR